MLAVCGGQWCASCVGGSVCGLCVGGNGMWAVCGG